MLALPSRVNNVGLRQRKLFIAKGQADSRIDNNFSASFNSLFVVFHVVRGSPLSFKGLTSVDSPHTPLFRSPKEDLNLALQTCGEVSTEVPSPEITERFQQRSKFLVAMQQFMWQLDIVGVAHFVMDCFDYLDAAGASPSNQP